MLKEIFSVKRIVKDNENLKIENEKYKETTHRLNDKIIQLTDELNSKNECTCANNKRFASYDNFITEKFKKAYNLAISDSSLSDDDIYRIFHEMINREHAYLIGFIDAVDFIKNKRNKKISIEKQFEKQFTSYGLEKINELINEKDC